MRGVSDDVTTVSMRGVSGAACTPPSSKCLTSTVPYTSKLQILTIIMKGTKVHNPRAILSLLKFVSSA